MSKIILIVTLFFSWSSIIYADTLVQIKTEDGNISKIMSNGKMTRISMAPEPGYILINHANQNMHMVIPEEKTIMNMSADMTKKTAPVKVNIKIKEIGKGPKIAGYSTKKYAVTADGQDCGMIYGSKKALKNTDINNIFNALNKMMENQSQMMGGMSEMMDACDRADMSSLADQGKIAGLPLRTTDRNGALTSEVLSIDSKANLPATNYELPSDYKMTSMAEEMQNMQQQMADEMQQHMPDMEKMMQQMGKGEMPPEAMEQMKRMQEMMKQYQQ